MEAEHLLSFQPSARFGDAHIASQCPKLLCLLTSSLQLSPLKQDCHFAESFEEEVFFRPLSHFNIGKLAPFWPG